MAEPLTRGQEIFAGTFAHETGLDPHVIGAWLKAEQSGSAAENYEHKSYYNWLNIGNTKPEVSQHNSVWAHPQTAAKAAAEWIKGQGAIAHEYGRPAPGVMAILHSAGRTPQEQIHAIATSGWAESGYNGGETLRQLYGELAGRHIGIIGAAQRVASAPGAAAPVVPEGQLEPPKPNPIDAITALHGTQSAGEAKTWEMLKELFQEGKPPEPTGTQSMPTNPLPGEVASPNRTLEYATQHLGKFAESSGANLGPELNKLEQQFGMTGEPWCAIFATTAISQGGASRETRTASVAQINQWASEGSHGYQKGLRSSTTARPGDLLTFGNDHVAVVKEVKGGHIITIEGNANGSGGVVQLSHPVGEGQIARPVYRSRGR